MMDVLDGSVYVSPHLDDAALSCGGQITEERDKGSPVTVVTLFAGVPRYDSLSEFARSVLEEYGEPDWMEKKRSEDAEALEMLGVRILHLDELEALFRMDSAERNLYQSWEEILSGRPKEADDEVTGRLAGHLRSIIADGRNNPIYFPMAFGGHVDHVIANRVGKLICKERPGCRVLFYEDQPYPPSPGIAVGYELSQACSIDLERKMQLVRRYPISTRVRGSGEGFFDAIVRHARRAGGRARRTSSSRGTDLETGWEERYYLLEDSSRRSD